MSDLERYKRALINADKAGDEDAARKFAAKIRELQAPEYPIEAPNALERIGRGYADVYQGVKQKYLNWTDPEAAQEYTQQVNQDIARYQQGRGPDAGIDWMRIAGSAAPYTLIPGGGQSAMARALLGAAAGGGAGYTLYSPSNQEGDNMARTIIGAGTGGLLNLAAPYVIRGATRAIQGGKNLIGGMLRRGPTDDAVRAALRQSGIDLNKLSQQVQRQVLADAREQLKASGHLSPAQLARRADIESVAGPGMGTRGQITRDPAAWTQERNLQRTEVNMPSVQRGAIPTLTQRYQQQSQAALKYADNLTDDISGAPASQRAGTNLRASEKAIQAIQSQDKAAEGVVDDLYKAYREAGINGEVPDTAIADELGRVADEIGVENIPAPVLNRLKEFGFMGAKRTKLLTVNEADKLNRLINNNTPGHGPAPGMIVYGSADPAIRLALGRLKTAVNEAVAQVPDEGSKALMTARKAAADRFAAQRAGAGIEQAIKDVPPDRFFERYVMGGPVRDLTQLKAALNKTAEGRQAWNELRARAWEQVVDKSTQEGRKAINGTQFDRAMNRIGEDRLSVLFTPDELARINQLRRGVSAMTVEPDYTGVNYSNTTPAAMGMMARSTGIPGIGMVTQPMENYMQRAAAENAMSAALRGQGVNTAARDAMQQQLRNRLSALLAEQRPAYLGPLLPAYMQQNQ